MRDVPGGEEWLDEEMCFDMECESSRNHSIMVG